METAAPDGIVIVSPTASTKNGTTNGAKAKKKNKRKKKNGLPSPSQRRFWTRVLPILIVVVGYAFLVNTEIARRQQKSLFSELTTSFYYNSTRQQIFAYLSDYNLSRQQISSMIADYTTASGDLQASSANLTSLLSRLKSANYSTSAASASLLSSLVKGLSTSASANVTTLWSSAASLNSTSAAAFLSSFAGPVAPIFSEEALDSEVETLQAELDAADKILAHPQATFLTAQSMQTPHQGVPHYSGMWWMNRERFLRFRQPMQMSNLESATWFADGAVGGLGRVVMTKDWLDFSVEHLSGYIKKVRIDETSTFLRLKQIFRDYLVRAAQRPKHLIPAHVVPAQQTIGIVPVYSTIGAEAYPRVITDNDIPASWRHASVNSYALACSLLSMRQLGIPRIVVTGRQNTTAPPVEYRAAMDLLRNVSALDIAIPYYYGMRHQPTDRIVPKYAIWWIRQTLQELGTPQEQIDWLGGNGSAAPWKYVYFSESDLLLNTRASAQLAIKAKLDEGMGIGAHRLQSLPHHVDFPQTRFHGNVIPPVLNMGNLTNVNADEQACCDGGNWYPGRSDYPHCWMWFQCGFNGQTSPLTLGQAEGLHQRLLPYPNLRLTQGLNVKFVAASARVCYPMPRDDCTEGFRATSKPTSSPTLKPTLVPTTKPTLVPTTVAPTTIHPTTVADKKDMDELYQEIEKQKRGLEEDPQQLAAETTTTAVAGPPPEFMTAESMIHQHQGNPHYSGMWWANRNVVSRIKTPEKIMSLEVGSRAAWDVVGRSKILMTRDWLDLAVEHLSGYFKRIPFNDEDESFRRLKALFFKYMKRALQTRHERPNEASAVSKTLVVIPIFGNPASNETLLTDAVPPVKLRGAAMNSFSLAATLVSLWKLRMPRAVIVGNHEKEPLEVSTARNVFSTVLAALEQEEEDPLQISYIYGKSQGTSNYKIIPAFALSMLQHAFKGNMTQEEQMAWFGKDSSSGAADSQRWEYVYYTETDLLLHTRTSAQAAIKQRLDQGMLLAAHRFQPLPHIVDYPDTDWLGQFIPSVGPFANFSNLDTETDACCDQGNRYPGRDPKLFDWCWMWFQCGIKHEHATPKNESVLLKRFERQAAYPTIRITNGLNVMLLAESSRLCFPAKRGSCNKSGN